VKVIITTHSPTTVAMSNEESLYQMDKNIGYPLKATKTAAINILTKGLYNIRISAENRRQIFVEDKYDIEYYERIYPLLDCKNTITPCFLAPHSGNGTNCTDVIDIVTKLSEMGNDLVYGIIDYDNTNHTTERIKVLGENNRYAIENFIFDPIYVGLLLFRCKIIEISSLGLSVSKYPDLNKATQSDFQKIIDYVMDELGFGITKKIQYQTRNGMMFNVSKEYFTIQGHELETKLVTKWPQLNGIKK
jgi:hypothetical protein